jgi:hypothetical protein
MVAALLKPQAKNNWFGTIVQGWTNEPINLDLAEFVCGKIGYGRFFKGHAHYTPEFERLLHGYGIAMAFVYRDLRDVAISQTHHIMTIEYHPDGTEKFVHPGRDKFLALGGFDEVLLAVIEGLDEYPGVLDRWEVFAPWLDVEWVFPVQFEEMRKFPANIAGRFHDYIVQMSLLAGGADIREAHPSAYPQKHKDVMHMIKVMTTRQDLSVTFRKGDVGDWRHEFTPAAKAAFKAADKNDWLVRMGYARNNRW